MTSPTGSAGSLASRLFSWLVLLMIGAIVLQILLAELVRWVTILAPWLLLTLALGLLVPLAGFIRRRFSSY